LESDAGAGVVPEVVTGDPRGVGGAAVSDFDRVADGSGGRGEVEADGVEGDDGGSGVGEDGTDVGEGGVVGVGRVGCVGDVDGAVEGCAAVDGGVVVVTRSVAARSDQQ
jgi:hypothetical protein